MLSHDMAGWFLTQEEPPKEIKTKEDLEKLVKYAASMGKDVYYNEEDGTFIIA